MADCLEPRVEGEGGERPGPLHEPGDERQARALAAAVAVAGESDLDVSGAGVWRAGSAVLVGLPEVPALARVDEPARADDARRQALIARLLRAVHLPAVRLVGPSAQPVPSPAGPVTLWAWVAPSGPRVGPFEMGRVARALHDRTRSVGPAHDVPRHDPLPAVRAELDRAARFGATSPDDLALLHRVTDGVARRWPRTGEDPLGQAVVHGDLHRANVIPGPAGPVLADLELAGRGPASVDVAPQVVAVRRYGADPHDLERFLAGYGADPRGWAGFDVLVEAYELWVTAWAVANRTSSARADREAEVRLERWRRGRSLVWSLR